MNFSKYITVKIFYLFFRTFGVSIVFFLEKVCKIILIIKNNDVFKIGASGISVNRSYRACDLINVTQILNLIQNEKKFKVAYRLEHFFSQNLLKTFKVFCAF